MALGWGDQKGFRERGAFGGGALQVKKGEGVYQADGARGRPCQQMRGTAEGQQEGGQNLRLKRWTEISNAMKPSADHTSPSGADTPSGDHAYPIHGDVGPVVDAPVGWRERGWLAAVFRKCCSVQHKPKILVREGWKTNPSLWQFVLREPGHPRSACKWCF